MGEHRPARVHPSGEKQHLKRHGHRVGAVIACERRQDRERLVRMSSHQVAGHLHAREVIAGELAGFGELGEICVTPVGDKRRPCIHVS